VRPMKRGARGTLGGHCLELVVTGGLAVVVERERRASPRASARGPAGDLARGCRWTADLLRQPLRQVVLELPQPIGARR
jgi:hypothetical protein